MTTQAKNADFKLNPNQLVRQFIIWVPIVIGLIHQLLMGYFGVDRIYVFLNPPKYIYPFVTLEAGWWFLLTLVTAVLFVLSYLNRVRPRRIVYPFYAYFVFLLILVKPI